MVPLFRFSLIVFACLGLLVLSTCGGDGPTKPIQPPSPPPVQPVPTRITITPAAPTLTTIGQTLKLTASVLDQNGQPITSANVLWSSSNTTVVSVSTQGLVTAVRNGTVQITARSGSASAAINVKVTVINTGDREALIALFNSTNGPNWQISINWGSDEPLDTWHGVSTNTEGRVTHLQLRENNLRGRIPSELLQLSQLTELSFRYNQLSGLIPSEIGQLRNLTILDLYSNRLTGPIPSEIGQLQSLVALEFSYNRLTGPIPTEIGQLQKLRQLGLGWNRLSGIFPAEIGQLENLRILYLEGSDGIFGSLPVEITQSKQMRALNLRYTQVCVPPTAVFHEWVSGISDKIGVEFCADQERSALIALYMRTDGMNWNYNSNWTSNAPLGDWFGVTTDTEGKVSKLVLPDNNLYGSLPSELSNLTNLRTLNLSNNAALTGNLPLSFTGLALDELELDGTQVCAPSTSELQTWIEGIPVRSVARCAETRPDYHPLVALYQSTNGPNWTNSTNWLSDAPFENWSGVTINSVGRVTSLNLNENNLQGMIPPEIGQLDSLAGLNLEANQITGSIPPEIGQLENLESLLLRLNELSGAIPTQIGQLENLESLDFFANILSGSIPAEMGQLENLKFLNLSNNLLSGPIPPEIGQLQNLTQLQLWGNELTEFPPEIGQLQNLTLLLLSGNSLTEVPPEIGQLQNLTQLLLGSNSLAEIPPEIGQLQNLTQLQLSFNSLAEIPPEIGQLQNLTQLTLSGNSLAEIPPEIGQLQNLTQLQLGFNSLAEIPPEIGQLQNLMRLQLGGNNITEIPTEIGQLENLEWLHLSSNLLTGAIPPEIGQLQYLVELDLHENELEEPIPPELGQLLNLRFLNLQRNRLSGSIPLEFGQLTRLSDLRLSYNELTGNIPESIGDLTHLRSLRLTDNAGMSGTLPRSLVNLNLEDFFLGGTQLCISPDTEYRVWLKSIPNSRVLSCRIAEGRSRAYLTQATQSLDFPVALVAGEDALLRVFVVTDMDVDVPLPPVRAEFYQNGTEVYAVDIPSFGAIIPRQIQEVDLSVTANARIPGSVLTPGLEMVIEIDPDGELDPALGISSRLPPEGRMSVDVERLPPFDLTVVPFQWTQNPNESYLSQINGLSAESDELRLTRDLLPIGDFSLNVYEPQWISVAPKFENAGLLFRLIDIIRTMEGSSGYFLGIFDGSGGGIAQLSGKLSVSTLALGGEVIAHELGHNLSLRHTVCGNAGRPDPDFPYQGGAIGAWGYDLLNDVLVSPGATDLMGYCRDRWISDYHFNKAMGYRLSQATTLVADNAAITRSLLLWGGVNEDGEIVLEPAFVVDAPPSSPQQDGPYDIAGEDKDGRILFNLSFDMAEIADGEGGSFAFILPVQSGWQERLNRISLSGPEGIATLGGESNEIYVDAPAAALLLDPITGKVRGYLRDWSGTNASVYSARRVLPEPGLEIITSRGLPESADW